MGTRAFDNLIWPTFDTFIWPTLRPLFSSSSGGSFPWPRRERSPAVRFSGPRLGRSGRRGHGVAWRSVQSGRLRSFFLLPPFHRAPEAIRLRAGFDDVRAVGDAVQQRFAQPRIRSKRSDLTVFVKPD
jgi:hypothetical protein